jgi:hypothetical protein
MPAIVQRIDLLFVFGVDGDQSLPVIPFTVLTTNPPSRG